MKRTGISSLFIIMILFSCCSWGTGTGDSPTREIPELPIAQTGLGNTYYVSPLGNDAQDGLSPAKAWKSLERVNTASGSSESSLSPGDSVLFEKGGVYRGTLYPKSGTSTTWISYGSYGTGEKPILNGSVQLNTPEDWELVTGNIWRSKITLPCDIGALYNGADGQIGNKKWAQVELIATNDYFYNSADKKLYFYAAASPETIHTSLEAALTRHVIDQSNSRYILFEGLHLTKGSAHGFGGGNTDHLIIRNCDFSYLGGGLLAGTEGEPVRYGNGIEFWGNASNNLVLNCQFWEIYDTALTNQNHSSRAIQKNLFYINNIIYNCGLASFEIWNRPSNSQISKVYFIHNSSINPGQGWGAEHRPDKNSFHIASFYNEALTDNIVIMNNIFFSSSRPAGADNSTWYHLFLYDENANGNFSNYVIDYNLWQMPQPLWAIKPEPAQSPELFSSFSSWKTSNNQSMHGLTGDPLFTDITNPDMTLRTGSPAINSGTSILMDFRPSDFDGRTALGIPDMGAWESVSIP